MLGFVGDALAIGGLAALAVPAAVRVLAPAQPRAGRRRARRCSRSLALAAFAAFVVELIRFPQRYGDPIKSSYLLFTAPCWAIFSVAAWAALRSAAGGSALALVAVAALYVASYGDRPRRRALAADRARG